MSEKIYYKVVQRLHRTLYSCRAINWGLYGYYCTKYTPNKWTEPKIKGTRLFIFKDLKSATSFAKNNEEIWECRAEGVGRIRPLGSTFCIKSYWEDRFKKKSLVKYAEKMIHINGSLSAKRVFLLKKVENV